MKEKNNCRIKKLWRKQGLFIWLYQKTGRTNFDELQVIDSSNNEGTNSLVIGESGRKGWFIMHSHATSVIKLAIGMVVPISSILSLLILYTSKNM